MGEETPITLSTNPIPGAVLGDMTSDLTYSAQRRSELAPRSEATCSQSHGRAESVRGGDLRGNRRALYQDLMRKDKEDRRGTTAGPRGWPDRDEAAGLGSVAAADWEGFGLP